MRETIPLADLADAGERIGNLQDRVLELEDNVADSAVVADIEHDISELSSDVANLQEASVTYDDVSEAVRDGIEEAVTDAVKSALSDLLDYAALRVANGDSGAKLLDVLRDAVRYE